ncbi:2-hydroxyacid dehydrogenase [Paraburkholderia sp. ZP32-5]|uniref:2-hydroxyacid dehydrogenase n=1 Tax=Paraburkholderia sp. ZP32-5 TaxID=2883245 RepID=UPI001F283BD3|nr:glyoxylate/hydroxypyruvate reductase A [Paraburkholderia sp. ZP32-5]
MASIPRTGSAAPPTVAFIWSDGDAAAWRERMTQTLGEFDMRVYPDIGNAEDIDFAMVWMPPCGELKRYPNLKGIFSIGAGVSHILRDPELPRHVPIVRLTDDTLSLDMSCHAIHWVLHFHRGYDRYLEQQRAGIWHRPPYPPNATRRIGILGMGAIGEYTARCLRDLQFDVAGWSRTQKALNGVQSFFGDDQLEAFLNRTDILVCVLPPTPATTGLIDAKALAMLPAGAYLVNMGRGEVLHDDALLAALDSGHIAAAALDVFVEEPLPSASRYWQHPRVRVTPHAAGPTSIEYGSRRIAENMLLLRQGVMPDAVMDAAQGY